MLLRVVFIFINSQNNGDILIFCWSRNNYFLGTAFHMSGGFGGIGKKSGRFDNYLNTKFLPFDIGWIALSQHLNFVSIYLNTSWR